MANGCPQCKDHTQVLSLPEFWRSLSQDAELKRSLAQPPAYVAQWLVPLGLGVGAVLVFLTGGVLLGLLLIAAGVAAGAWMFRQTELAEAARARWARLQYCRRCPAQFTPEEAV